MRHFFMTLVLLCGCHTISAQNAIQSQAAGKYPKVVEAVAPDYPDEDLPMGDEGRVVVAVDISQKGVVDSAKTLSGPAIFAQAALDAAKRWRFVESEDRQKRVAELTFIFLREDSSVSFFPPNQIVVARRPGGGPGENVDTASHRLGENDEEPEVIKYVAPSYPAIAVQAHASGPVNVEVRIDDKGNVIGARAKNGHPLLQSSSVAAARRWEFASSVNAKERSVTLTFIFNPNIVEKDAGPSFISPYKVEINPRPQRIDITNN